MRGSAIVRNDGAHGTVIADRDTGQFVVEFGDGSHQIVSTEELVRQQDGSYYLTPRTGAGEEIVVPVVAEELAIETHQVARGKVTLKKRIETREELVEIPAAEEQIVVERVPIGKYVDDGVPEVHDENGVTVIPLIEEVYVVEKRLFLREEVRVSKRRTVTQNTQTVTLRREVVDIEREDF